MDKTTNKKKDSPIYTEMQRGFLLNTETFEPFDSLYQKNHAGVFVNSFGAKQPELHLAFTYFKIPRNLDLVPGIQSDSESISVSTIFNGNTPDIEKVFCVTYCIEGTREDLDKDYNVTEKDVKHTLLKETKYFATYAEAIRCHAEYLVQIASLLVCPQPLLLMGIPK